MEDIGSPVPACHFTSSKTNKHAVSKTEKEKVDIGHSSQVLSHVALKSQHTSVLTIATGQVNYLFE